MNILLWVAQVALALLYVAGGAYKLTSYDVLANQIGALPPAGWRVLGAIEVVGGILLIVPAAIKRMPVLTPIAAAVLTVETLGLAALYARQSLTLTAANPLVWAAVMALLVGFVAYGRYSLRRTA